MVSSGAALTMMLGPGLANASEEQEGQKFFESSCRKNEQTSKRILIAYGSRCGSTGSIAEVIGDVLGGAGASVRRPGCAAAFDAPAPPAARPAQAFRALGAGP